MNQPDKPQVARFNDRVFTLAVTIVIASLSAGICMAFGPFPVWGQGEKTHYVAGAMYMVPLALPFGILMAEALIDFHRFRFSGAGLISSVVLLLLSGISIFRLLEFLDISGHTLVLGYFILHEVVENRRGRGWKLVVGSLVLLITAWFKLVAWKDPQSLLLGLGMGLLLFGLERFLRRWSKDPRVWYPSIKS